MNLRQTQRAVADVVSKCQDAHIQLPVDAFDGMLSATEALRHSRVGNKLHVDDAVEELKQRYGLDPKRQQIEDASEAKRASRQNRKRLRHGDDSKQSKGPPKQSTLASDTDSAESEASLDTLQRGVVKKPKAETPIHGSSRIDRIIENNPAKNPKNEELAEEFVELGGYEITHGQKQKGISRMAVAKQIREAAEPIASGKQARALPHVGPSAAAKIDEVLHRGKMNALEEYEEEKQQEESRGSRPIVEDETGEEDEDIPEGGSDREGDDNESSEDDDKNDESYDDDDDDAWHDDNASDD